MHSSHKNRIWAIAKALLGVCVLSLLVACANVKPFEREHLADPIMELSSSQLSDVYEQHMHRALAQGLYGLPIGSGGCGCEQ